MELLYICWVGTSKLRDSIRIRIGRSIRFESDGPIRKFSNWIGIAQINWISRTEISIDGPMANSIQDSIRIWILTPDSRFDSNANGRFAGP